ncbi:MAG: radical SAM protein [Elusimicrobiota bacterium]|nr:radical SAM protein [Elusimicrobiota bacterium]
MARLLLVRPPSVFSAASGSAPVTMPLSIAYLASSLLAAGHEVECIDGLGEAIDRIGVSYGPGVRYRGLSSEEIAARARARPDAIGVTTMFSQDWPHIEGVIAALRARFPDAPIIVGGEHATACAEYILRDSPQVDFVASGEGERTMVEFADALDGRGSTAAIAGLHYRGEGGAPVANPPRARLRAPDDLPLPAWHLFDLEPYFRVGEGHGVERGRSMPLVATRGCPYQCTFCSNPLMWTTRYVMRDPERVLDEIEHYQKAYRADNIDFYDLTAIVKKSWVMDFCRAIEHRGLRFTWQLPSGTRSEALDAEVLAAMAATGCTNMTYAPESGSERVLEDIKKKVNLPRLYESIRHAKREGIFVKCNLIIGFPRETRADMLKTVWAAARFALSGVDDCGLYTYSPYHGSELYDYLRKTGSIPRMDRPYFESLMTFMDVSQPTNYCENVGAREIAFYRVLGLCVFYGLHYLLHPAALLRAWRNFRAGRSDTVIEQRLFALVRRRRLVSRAPTVN